MKIKKGQLWKENDKRFTRVIQVMGFEGDKVLIKTIAARLPYTVTGRLTKASKTRFNDKSRGYSLHRDVK